MPLYSSRQFTFTKDFNLQANASAICPDRVPLEGFQLQLARTGEILQYFLAEKRHEAEGDVAVWIFRCVDDPTKVRQTVTIFNDYW